MHYLIHNHSYFIDNSECCGHYPTVAADQQPFRNIKHTSQLLKSTSIEFL